MNGYITAPIFLTDPQPDWIVDLRVIPNWLIEDYSEVNKSSTEYYLKIDSMSISGNTLSWTISGKAYNKTFNITGSIDISPAKEYFTVSQDGLYMVFIKSKIPTPSSGTTIYTNKYVIPSRLLPLIAYKVVNTVEVNIPEKVNYDYYEKYLSFQLTVDGKDTILSSDIWKDTDLIKYINGQTGDLVIDMGYPYSVRVN